MALSSNSCDPTDESAPLVPNTTTNTNNNNSAKPISKYPPATGRNVLAFVLAFTCNLCAASISLFAIFAPSIQHDTGLRIMDINCVAIAAEIGMYIPVPLIGYMADQVGPGSVGILATFLFTPAYYISGLVVQAYLDKNHGLEISTFAKFLIHHDISVLSIAFFSIGLATSALHFCGVVGAAKVLPQYPGLSISIPIACFGISSLWQSQVVSKWFTVPGEDGGHVKIVQVFNFFAILYILTGFVSYFSTHVCLPPKPIIHQDKLGQPIVVSNNSQTLLGSDDACDTASSTYQSTDTTLTAEEPDRNNTYKRDPNTITLPEFFADKTVWIFFTGFVIATGPLEMFVNNMGMIINTIPIALRKAGPVATHVSLFSLFSTLARLSMGLMSDVLHGKVPLPYIYSAALLCTAALQFATSAGFFTVYDGGSLFSVLSSASGFAYGSCFSLTPTVVSTVWGLESFGTHYGVFILGPALGATFCGYLFAAVYQNAAARASPGDINNMMSAAEFVGQKLARATASIMSSDNNLSPEFNNAQCYGLKCYQDTFLTTGVMFVTAAVLVFSVYKFYWKPTNRMA
ncbi:uncharacterized protein SAPINGB_P004535 [Magnusiomyces paraingens]|uniref:Probable transporter MCH1 n=1 Tax=Magnusiomyces paraingens TaxID=2606893 RepID=A0A5E8C2G2_9ASCO|nr:uncharacterized protein SAPINGB_P004535 [Saprochaete ingens]VVT55315.1 unnamed protein product [Saprochaete ingens]